MGESRFGPLAALVVTLVIISALGPALIVAAAPTLPPGVVVKGTLSNVNQRDDYNFTAQQGEWTVVASNNYAGDGVLIHGLRSNISATSPFIQTAAGSIANVRRAAVIAINGHTLPSSTNYVVSEELNLYSPSYAVQLLKGMTTLSRTSQTFPDALGTDGIVKGYEITLFKRDMLDLRLRVPPEWTYNYHFSMLLFSPTERYHQFEGEGGVNPVAVSDAGENSEQALTYLAMDPGTYLIVLLNEGTPDDVSFDLEISLNGLPLSSGVTDDETLTRVNQDDYYSFNAPNNTWSAIVTKARDDIDTTVTHSLHYPTPDSNTIAYDELTTESPTGIIAINGYELSALDTYYVRERYTADGTKVPFTIQFDTSSKTLSSSNDTTAGTITSSDIFILWEIDLQASQTADFRLRVNDDYTYDYDLGMYIFPPENKYYSISGQLPDYARGPVAMSRAGENTEQDAVFTCTATGTYAVAIVNFAQRDTIPFTLEVTIQGKTLADDSPRAGDLNAQNQADLFQFTAQWDTWNVVGSRIVSPDGALYHKLHNTALDTNPIREEHIGQVPTKEGKYGTYENNPLGLLAVDGHELVGDTTYFIREEVSMDDPLYVVELANNHIDLAAATGNLTSTFSAGEFIHTYTVDLAEHDTIDLRVAPPEDWTYHYNLGIYVLPPGSLYRNLGTADDVGALSVPGDSLAPALVYTATTGGQHLIVVANLGTLGTLDYELDYAVDGFPTSAGLSVGRLDEVNTQDALRFNAPFGMYTMVVVRLPETGPAAPVTATLRWPSIDSVALATATLTSEAPVGAFIINGETLPMGSQRHFLHLEAAVPEGRTVAYQVQVETEESGLPGGVVTLQEEDIGVLYSQFINKTSTVDLALRVPPDYTYAYDLGLYLFGPGKTYMSTDDPEAGPLASSRYGPGTEQEVIFTSRNADDYAILVLNQGSLEIVDLNFTHTTNGQPLDVPARGYVDEYNRNEQFRFVANANTWNVLASSHVGGSGDYDLKLLTNGLSTNPIATQRTTPEKSTGVIAINGWELEEATKLMFANVSNYERRSDFVVHAATEATEFGTIGHSESERFGEDEIAFIYLVDLQVSDHLEVSLDYDTGNWSSDVLLDLMVFEPDTEVLSEGPVATFTLRVTEGRIEQDGDGMFLAERTGTYGFVLVNHGPLGKLGFTLGLYKRAVINQPPMYPSIIDAEASTDKVRITWVPNQESDFKKYEIYLSSVTGQLGDRIDTIGTQTMDSDTISRLDPDHQYYVTLIVYDDEGLFTSSNPYPVTTDKLEPWQEPMVWVIVGVIVIAFLAIVAIDWFIKRQKAATATPSETGPTATGPEPELEVEGVEDAGPAISADRGPEDERTRDRTEAVDFMHEMMGDEEGT